MAVLNITYSPTGLSSVNPNLLYITTDDTYADVLVSGYLNKSRSVYGNIFSNYQMAMVYTTDNYTVLLQVVIAGGNTSLQQFATGAGDVTGPNTSTDNALVRYNGTSGQLIQNSTSILDDDGNLTIPLSAQTINFIAGSSGTGGVVTIYPDDPLSGQFNIVMVSNLADDPIYLSIGNFAQATFLSITDPGDSIGRILVAAGNTPFIDGNIPKASGTFGAMVDSGIAASSIITGTPSALTTGSDTNIGLTLGGMSSTALLQAVSITPTWSGTLSGARGGTGIANTGKTITLGGNLETSGAFNAVLTLTGNTNVTFPTTGILATTDGASIPSVVEGDLLYGSATNVLSALNKNTNATRYLANTGLNNSPAWSRVNLTNGVNGILPGANGGTGVANSGKTITLDGNLQVSGAFDAIFTLEGDTNVTFPPTGTLATIADIPTDLGTMAYQNSNSVSITGGNVNNVNINSATIGSSTINNVTMNGGTIDNISDFSAGNFTITGAISNGQYAGSDLFMGLIDGGGNDRAVMRTDGSGTTRRITLGDSSANTLVITPTSLVTNGTFSRILPAAAQGDLLYASATNTWSNLNKNTTATRYLSNTGTNNNPAWAQINLANGVTGSLPWSNISVPTSVSGKNMVLNGDFKVSQAGTSFSFSNSFLYTFDRWQCGSGGTVSMIYQQLSTITGDYFARVQRTSGTSGTGGIQICTTLTIDMCVGAAGNPVTLSFQARRGDNFSASGNVLTVRVISGTGSSDQSPITTGFTGAVNQINTTQALTTTFTTYTFTTPTLSSSVTQLGIQIFYDPTGTAGTNDYFDITNVKLEIGSTATPFIHDSLAVVLPQVYRFRYIPQFSGGGFPRFNAFGQCVSSTQAQVILYYYVPMRNTPSATLTAANTFGVSNSAGTVTACTAISAIGPTATNCLIQATVASGLTAGDATQLMCNNSTTYIDLFAELT